MLKKNNLEEIARNIISLLQSEDHKKIRETIQSFHAADIAEIIKKLPDKESRTIFKIINEKKSAAILVELEEDIRARLLSSFSAKEIAEKIINNLESDDAVDVISELEEKEKSKVLSYVKRDHHAKDISDLLHYPDNSAGGLMATELIKVNENWSTLECLKEMRKQAEGIKEVHTIYVINNKNQLLGSLSLKRLLITETKIPIKNIIRTKIISVRDNETSEEVSNIMNKYDLVVLPVVDKRNRLIGRITIDDVINIVKEEAEKDYQMASGISEDIESSDSIWQITRARLPWLIIGLFGGIIGAEVIENFKIDQHFKLALFIPLIAAMGGNVGIQSAAIVVQGIANNSVKNKDVFRRLLKEFGISLIQGIICSSIIFLVILLTTKNIHLSLAVSLSLLCVIIFAALFGTFIPLTLEKYKIDPALATGPFITTINDIFGLIIYLKIGQIIL